MSSRVSAIPDAVAKVHAYFNTHVTKTYEWRKKQLEGLIAFHSENESAIVSALQSDLGKPMFESSTAEVITTIAEIRTILHNLSSWMKPEYVDSPLAMVPASSYIVREPYGVVLIIGPFNYPIQLTILPLLAALAAGNAAVIKPSELTPNSTQLLATLLPRYVDPQAVLVIQGEIAETTALLALKWDYIFFTGSEAVGKIVMKAAAEHLTPVTLELGGKSPVIVDADADVTLAARRTLWGKAMNAGQSCVAPDYVYVHSSIKQAFIRALQQHITQFYGTNPATSPDLGRIVNERHAQRLKRIIEAHKQQVITGGVVDVAARYVSPTLLDLQNKPMGAAMEQEIFGPILPILEYTDINTVINYINSHAKPLSLYIFSNNQNTIDTIIAQTSSGGVTINDTILHFVNKELPFGGVGNSGMGSYHGKHGYLTLSHAKSVVHKSLYLDPPARYPPYTIQNYRLYRYILNIIAINQGSVQRVLKFVLIPIIIAVIAKKFGVFATIQARL